LISGIIGTGAVKGNEPGKGIDLFILKGEELTFFKELAKHRLLIHCQIVSRTNFRISDSYFN
jgi:hypothetical protein